MIANPPAWSDDHTSLGHHYKPILLLLFLVVNQQRVRLISYTVMAVSLKCSLDQQKIRLLRLVLPSTRRLIDYSLQVG